MSFACKSVLSPIPEAAVKKENVVEICDSFLPLVHSSLLSSLCAFLSLSRPSGSREGCAKDEARKAINFSFPGIAVALFF